MPKIIKVFCHFIYVITILCELLLFYISLVTYYFIVFFKKFTFIWWQYLRIRVLFEVIFYFLALIHYFMINLFCFLESLNISFYLFIIDFIKRFLHFLLKLMRKHGSIGFTSFGWKFFYFCELLHYLFFYLYSFL